jgi:alpha-maltose-1-phosphate synthase
MRLLLLCEGDPEAGRGSWSGSSHSLLQELRAAGHSVRTGDTELYGLFRYVGAAASFSPDRQRWSVRFRLGGMSAWLRTRRARRHAANARADAVVQIGATFGPPGESVPYFLYCDSNIAMAELGRATGQSQAAVLSEADVARIRTREHRIYQGASGIFTLSERLRQSFLRDFGLPPDRVHTVYAGPNLDPAAIPDRPAAEGKPPTILFVGVRFERKGGDLLLAAFRRVREAIPDARLIIVGPRSLAVTDPGVDYRGFLSKDVPTEWQALVEAYSAADVFCLPTRFEPFGIVFVEAMFFGLPCIGPDAWAVPEIIDDGVTGLLTPPDDVDALADRLLRLLRDPARAREMGQAGRLRAGRLFTWQAVAGRIGEVVASRVAGGGLCADRS